MPCNSQNCVIEYSIGIKPDYVVEVKYMAYTITDDCISCGVCASNCPVNAISEGDGKFEIDADTCIECGACAENCPVGAPVQA